MHNRIPVRVLIIDDDEAVGRQLAGWLREVACDAVTFADGPDAVRHAERAPPQLALVDLRLGDVDGCAVIAELRRVLPALRVIALSAFPDVAQVVAAMRAGACDLLEKPIQREPLLTTVDRRLAEIGLAVRTETEFNSRLGARLRTVRTQAEKTLDELAAECGLTAAQLSQIELGKTATTTWSLARIAGALGLPLERLMSGL